MQIQTMYLSGSHDQYGGNQNMGEEYLHDVEFPSNRFDADADTIRVDHHGDVEEEEVETAAFGTGAVLEALDSVEGLQRRPAPSVLLSDSRSCHSIQ